MVVGCSIRSENGQALARLLVRSGRGGPPAGANSGKSGCEKRSAFQKAGTPDRAQKHCFPREIVGLETNIRNIIGRWKGGGWAAKMPAACQGF